MANFSEGLRHTRPQSTMNSQAHNMCPTAQVTSCALFSEAGLITSSLL